MGYLYLGTTQGIKKVIFENNHSKILHLKNLGEQNNVAGFLVKKKYIITKNQGGTIEIWRE